MGQRSERGQAGEVIERFGAPLSQERDGQESKEGVAVENPGFCPLKCHAGGSEEAHSGGRTQGW